MATQVQNLSPSGRPSMRFESTPGTFANGATVVIWVSPDKEYPDRLVVEISKAKQPFSALELQTEYEPWRKACIDMAANYFRKSQRIVNELREKAGVRRF